MTFTELLAYLEAFLPSSQLKPDVEILHTDDEDVLIHVVFDTNDRGFIRLSFQVPINRKTLATKSNIDPNQITDKDLEVFVERKHIHLLPYLQEYNGLTSDYDKLAELYYDTRGARAGVRFGF
ncbi:MAG: hypothetical protein EOP04_00470 [Proteobacteria bacterium]|nr:MAG: hypothetical protein EOP04_00470 [Pseudomonadota bacterium]